MQEFWDERARENAFFFVDNRLRYDDPNIEWFWAQGREDLDRVLREMDVEIDPSDLVVEVGCGVGRLTRVLAARAERVIALDVSDEMLAQARDHNAGLDNVAWLLGDGTSLAGVADAAADGCVSLLVFQHIPDPAITLGYVDEIGRVLKPGAWAVIQVSNDPGVHRPRRRVDRLGSRLKAVVGRAPAGQDHPAWLGSAVDLGDLGRAAEGSGMKVEAVARAGDLFCVLRLRKKVTPAVSVEAVP
jgi:SAM-dependent methyltransferase